MEDETNKAAKLAAYVIAGILIFTVTALLGMGCAWVLIAAWNLLFPN